MNRYIIYPAFIPHLGCPFECVYCNQRLVSGQVNLKPPQIRQGLNEWLVSIKRKPSADGMTRVVAFYGGSFTGLSLEEQQYFLTPATEAKRRGDIDSIRLSTRPDLIDAEKLAFLKKMLVDTVELGAQSMDDDVLKQSKRGHRAIDVKQAVDALRAHNLKVGLQIMPGLPGHTDRSIDFTISESIALKPDMVRIYPTVVLKGTALEAMFRKGAYKPLAIDDVVSMGVGWLKRFTDAGIPVIRLGLHPDPYLVSSNAVVAGPFHPALHYLIRCRMAREKLASLLRNSQPSRNAVVVIKVPAARLSEYLGNRRENIQFLAEMFDIGELEIIPDATISVPVIAN